MLKFNAYELILNASVGTKFILKDVHGKADWDNKIVTIKDEIPFTRKIEVMFYEPTEKGVIIVHGHEV